MGSKMGTRIHRKTNEGRRVVLLAHTRGQSIIRFRDVSDKGAPVGV